MVENQHQKISGYRDLSEKEIEAINNIKKEEIILGEMWQNINQYVEGVDPCWMAVAKTHLQQGFMAFVRAVAKPTDPFA